MKDGIIKFIRNIWPIGSLIAISAIVYHKWLSFKIFSNADYWFLFSETLRDWLNYSAWESQMGLGASNLFLWTYLYRLASGVFGFFGFDLNVADKFLIFWPFVFLTPIFTYLFVKEVLKNKVGALVGACVYAFSTYYISINTQGHLPLTLAGTFAPLAMLFFWRFFEYGKIKYLIISALVVAVVGGYDFRVFYMLFFILLALPFWMLFAQKGMEQKKTFFRKNFWPMAMFFGMLLFLNLFWILPTAITESLVSNEIVGRGLVPNNYFLDLSKSLTLFHPFWNGSEPDWFHEQDIPFHFWLIPAMVAVAIFWARKDRKILFWALVALVAVFVSKQDARPFLGVYPWLHEHFPGFNAFREASKFYFAILLSYSVLIGYFIKESYLIIRNKIQETRDKQISNSKFQITKEDTRDKKQDTNKIQKTILKIHNVNPNFIYGGLVFLVAMIFLWNVKPIVTGEMFEIFTPREIPKNELAIRDQVLKQEPFYRTLLVTEGSKFMTYSNAHPVVAVTNVRKTQWEKIFDFDSIQGDELGGSEKVKTFLSQSYATNVLSQSSFASLVVSEKDFFKVSELVKDPAWRESDWGLSGMRAFENVMVKPRIYLTGEKETIRENPSFEPVEFSSKNPARWDFAILEMKDGQWLNFSESFHPDWRLVCGDFQWYDAFFKNKMLSAENHSKTDAGFNAFRLDQEEWKRACVGESASLFYLPQAYLYLGGIISIVTVLISILFLIFWKGKKG